MKRILLLIFSIITLFFLPASAYCATSSNSAVAIFAGGCFWCMQADFDKVKGVEKTIVGYTGGNVKNPTYAQVTAGQTGHYEAIEVFYDTTKVSYQQLLDFFWHNIDPTNADGQFCDKGNQYRSAIFYNNAQEKHWAFVSKQQLLMQKPFLHIVTQILPAKTFYPAEMYHQEYYRKNPLRYRMYRYTCGRDKRLTELWQ